ncbi:hypothetical protein, partial [Methanobrevibacter sp.]|uniref:hypothetical protein n=1 Tax=Methanobrevibacter sp. TaxID=66852 RepID=UPI00388EDE54
DWDDDEDWDDDDWYDWDDDEDWDDDDWYDWDDDEDWDDEGYYYYDTADWDDYDFSYVNGSSNRTKLIKLAVISSYKPLIAYKTIMANDIACGNSCDDEDEGDVDLDESTDDHVNDSCMLGSASTSSVKVAGLSLGDTLKSVSKSIGQSQNIFDDEKETGANAADDNDYDTITPSSDNDLGIFGLLVSLLLSIVLLII